jgi:hypothetical protein
MSPPKSDARKVSFLLFKIVLKFLVRAVWQKKERGFKLFLFADDMILYLKRP